MFSNVSLGISALFATYLPWFADMFMISVPCVSVDEALIKKKQAPKSPTKQGKSSPSVFSRIFQATVKLTTAKKLE